MKRRRRDELRRDAEYFPGIHGITRSSEKKKSTNGKDGQGMGKFNEGCGFERKGKNMHVICNTLISCGINLYQEVFETFIIFSLALPLFLSDSIAYHFAYTHKCDRMKKIVQPRKEVRGIKNRFPKADSAIRHLACRGSQDDGGSTWNSLVWQSPKIPVQIESSRSPGTKESVEKRREI